MADGAGEVAARSTVVARTLPAEGAETTPLPSPPAPPPPELGLLDVALQRHDASSTAHTARKPRGERLRFPLPQIPPVLWPARSRSHSHSHSSCLRCARFHSYRRRLDTYACCSAAAAAPTTPAPSPPRTHPLSPPRPRPSSPTRARLLPGRGTWSHVVAGQLAYRALSTASQGLLHLCRLQPSNPCQLALQQQCCKSPPPRSVLTACHPPIASLSAASCNTPWTDIRTVCYPLRRGILSEATQARTRVSLSRQTTASAIPRAPTTSWLRAKVFWPCRRRPPMFDACR